MSDNSLLTSFSGQSVALIVSTITAAMAYLFNRKREREKQQRESKIKAYEALILSIAAVVNAKDKDAEQKNAAQEKFSVASTTFCVWADRAVLTALSKYMRDSTNVADPSKRTNIRLLRQDYVALVAAIRENIGIKFAVNEEVGTVTFGDEWETPRIVSVQTSNPLFVEVQDILKQLHSSTLNDKAEWAKRFHDLEQEQKLLWSLAEQVDSGQCTGSCIDLYISRVVAWESSLQRFIHDARLILRA